MVQWKWWNDCIFHCNYCWRDTCFHWTMSMGGRLHIILFLVGVFWIRIILLKVFVWGKPLQKSWGGTHREYMICWRTSTSESARKNTKKIEVASASWFSHLKQKTIPEEELVLQQVPSAEMIFQAILDQKSFFLQGIPKVYSHPKQLPFCYGGPGLFLKALVHLGIF